MGIKSSTISAQKYQAPLLKQAMTHVACTEEHLAKRSSHLPRLYVAITAPAIVKNFLPVSVSPDARGVTRFLARFLSKNGDNAQAGRRLVCVLLVREWISGRSRVEECRDGGDPTVCDMICKNK
jgi:hypothetical protein